MRGKRVILYNKFSICLEYRDLLLYSNVCWLSRGHVLSRFVCFLEPIKKVLNKKQKNYPELKD